MIDRARRAGAAVLVLIGGLVHLRLWDDGYKDFPNENLGRSFLLNAVASVVVAIALVAWRSWVPVVAALAVVNGTLLAFALSRTDRGIFGFTETALDPSPEAAVALVAEISAAAALVICLRGLRVPARSPAYSSSASAS